MKKTLMCGCLALACMVLPARAQTPSVPAGPSVIVTQGEATIKRAPDQAWLTIATETREPKAADARRLSAQGMTALQADLRRVGLSNDAIRTTGYSLMPEMDYKNGRGTVRGYLVRNQIEVRIDNLDRLADVIDTVNTSRSTAVSVTGPRFSLKDEKSAQADALREAVNSAMTRAQAIAEGAKRTLGPIARIEEHNLGNNMPPPQPMMMRMSAAAESAPTPIEPGEVEVRALITLTVELR